MHFRVDKKNKVGGMHIEHWDQSALGPAMTKKVDSYEGKSLDEFLKFVLKNKLFLKLQIFYMLKDRGAVYFWASSACFDVENANQFLQVTQQLGLQDCKYTEIHLKIKGQKNPIIPVLVEDVLAAVYQKCKYPIEVIELEMTPKDIKDISIDFNVARNKQHIIRNRVKMGGNEDKGLFMNMALKGLKFVGIGRDNSLEIFDSKKIQKFSKKDLEKYVTLVPTTISDEQDKAEYEQVLAKIQKIIGKPLAKESKKPVVKKEVKKADTKKKKTVKKQAKEEKKGFFSRLFKK